MKKNILITAVDKGIGDLILLTTLINAIKENFKSHDIYVIASHGRSEAIENNPYIKKIYSYYKLRKPLHTLKLFLTLRLKKFDLWFDSTDRYSFTSYLLLLIGNPKTSIGYNKKDKKKFTFDTSPYLLKNPEHITTRFLNILKAININYSNNKLSLIADNESINTFNKFLNKNQIKKYIYINISANKEIRYWPLTKWIEFISKINNYTDFFVICSSPKDTEKAIEIINNTKKTILYETKSVNCVIPAIQLADYVITVDTSIVHIAAAFNKPILALFTGDKSNQIRYYPLSNKSYIVAPKGENKIIKDIDIDECVEGFKSLVE